MENLIRDLSKSRARIIVEIIIQIVSFLAVIFAHIAVYFFSVKGLFFFILNKEIGFIHTLILSLVLGILLGSIIKVFHFLLNKL